jgi:hypothetical protein
MTIDEIINWIEDEKKLAKDVIEDLACSPNHRLENTAKLDLLDNFLARMKDLKVSLKRKGK